MRGRICSMVLAAALSVGAAGAQGITAGDEVALPAGGPGAGLQGTPAVAFGQGAYLAAWREGWHGKGGRARIYAARLSPEGKVLDPKGIEVAPAAAGVQDSPRVAFSGGVFLVVWQDFRNGKDYDVLGARVSPEGKVMDREPLAIAAGPHNQALPDMAGDGKAFLVVWQSPRGDAPAYRGWAAPVAADGKVGPAVETGAVPQPKVAWGGECYLAAGGGSGFWKGNVQGVRLGADGTPLGKGALVMHGGKDACFSLCGVPGKGWLVVSNRSNPDPWGWGGPGAIRAAQVSPEGRTLNEDAVKEPAGVQQKLPGWLDIGREKKKGATWPQGESAGAFDGKRSVVVWQRHHLCGEKMTEFENCDLIAARVEGFTSLDPEGVPVAATPEEERHPALASDGAGRLMLVYEKSQGEGKWGVFARALRTE